MVFQKDWIDFYYQINLSAHYKGIEYGLTDVGFLIISLWFWNGLIIKVIAPILLNLTNIGYIIMILFIWFVLNGLIFYQTLPWMQCRIFMIDLES